MSQDAPLSGKVKKAKRSAERKKQGKKRRHEVEDNALPAGLMSEGRDFISLEGESGDMEKAATLKPQKAASKKRKHEEATASKPRAENTRDVDDTQAVEPRPKKQKKRVTAESDARAEPAGEGEGKPADSAKQRFIVFVGNLPYNTTDDSLNLHFKKLHSFTLRHRTDPKTKKSKGFAFLEFENYDRMKTCLKLYHHSMFDPEDKENGGKGKGNGRGGRKINVELTVGGGGGKSKDRKEKIKAKNVRLDEQRRRRAQAEMKEKGNKSMKERDDGVKAGEVAGGGDGAPAADENVGMHPSRLARLGR